MVRECRPPAREPGRSWLARRSTMATSTPANANSPANISPVGPPPATTTACSAIRHPIPVGSGFGRRLCSTTPGLPQAPGALYTEIGNERVPLLSLVRCGRTSPVANPGQVSSGVLTVLALAAATDMAGAAHRRHLATPSPEIVSSLALLHGRAICAGRGRSGV